MRYGLDPRPRSWTRVAALTVAAVALSLAAGVSQAEAAKRPDLIVTALGGAGAAETGGVLRASATVRNSGAARAGRSTTAFYLSRDFGWSPDDRRLSPMAAIAALGPGRSVRRSTALRLPASSPLGNLFVVACADRPGRVAESNERNNCRVAAKATNVTSPESSQELIAAAEDAGAISHEEALIYSVFEDFGDPRLPAEFEARNSPASEGNSLELVAEEWTSLSQQTRDTLDPFFVPPTYVGSWAQPQAAGLARASGRGSTGASVAAATSTPGGGTCEAIGEISDAWGLVRTQNGKVTVWYQESFAQGRERAQTIARAIDRRIWPKLTGTFQAPLPDDGPAAACQGPDSSIDLILAPDLGGDNGQQIDYPPGCLGPNSGVVLVNRALSGNKALAVTAHELMHVIQESYPSTTGCSWEGHWLSEATGKWAEDFVYPSSNTEHPYASGFFSTPEQPLETYEREGARHYGTYVFFMYLARRHSPELVAATWAWLKEGRPLAALDSALSDWGGELDDEWHEFARYNWNAPPVDDYKRWDKLTQGTTADDYQSVDEPRTHEWHFAPMEHLSAAYNAYDFGSTASVGHVTVRNPLRGEDDARLQAIVELADGTRTVEDWTEDEEVTFCRKNAEERVVNIVLIASYADYLDAGTLAPAGPVEVVARKDCFPESWEGTASGTISYDGVVETFSATYTMERSVQGPVSAYYGYEDSSGEIEWAIAGTTSNGCTYSGGKSIDGVGSLSIYDDADFHSYGTSIARMWLLEHVTITQHCPPSDPEEIPYVPLNCACPDSLDRPYPSGANTLAGEREYTTEQGHKVKWSWELTAVP